MPEVGTGVVPIHPDFSRFGKELERGVGPHIAAAGKDMEQTFSASAKKSAASVDKAFASTKVDVPVTADTSKLRGELHREVEPLLRGVDADVPIGADTAGFGADVHRGIDAALKPVDIKVDADTSDFRNLPGEIRPHVKKAGEDIESTFAASAKGAGRALAGAIGVGLAIGFGKELLELGNQTAVFQQKTKTVFEDSTKDIQKWAKENSRALGLTETRLAGLAANFGDLLKPMGFTAKEAADLSVKALDLAGALSAWSGGQQTVADVSATLSKALLGEREELKGLGIAISEADVSTRLLEKGQAELVGTSLAQAKAVATQELIFEKSTDAQKAWADGSFDAIKKQNELRAKVSELVEVVATGLLPVFTAAATVLTALDPSLIKAAAGIGAIALGAIAVGKAASGLNALTAAAGSLNLGLGVATASAVSAGTALLGIGAAAAGIYAVSKATMKTTVDLKELASTADKELVRVFERISEFAGKSAADDAFAAILDKSITEAQRLVKALDAAGVETGEYQKAIDEAIGAEKAVVAVKEKDAAITTDLGDATVKTTDAIEAEKRALEELTDKVNDAFGASQSLIGSQNNVAGAIDSVRESGIEAAIKEKELAEAIRTHGRASNEAKAAAEALEDTRRAQLGDIDSLAQANVRLAEIQAKAAGATFDDADAYRVYRDELIKVKDTLAPDAPLRKHIEGLINQLPPPVIKSEVVLNTAKWEESLRQMEAAAKAFGGSAFFNIGQRKHSGGLITGSGNEVPALVQPGEYVMQRSAVAAIGVDTMARLNQFHSGGMVGGAQVLDRMTQIGEPLTTAGVAAGVTFNGGISVTGVATGEEALTRLPTRIAAELFLAGG